MNNLKMGQFSLQGEGEKLTLIRGNQDYESPSKLYRWVDNAYRTGGENGFILSATAMNSGIMFNLASKQSHIFVSREDIKTLFNEGSVEVFVRTNQVHPVTGV